MRWCSLENVGSDLNGYGTGIRLNLNSNNYQVIQQHMSFQDNKISRLNFVSWPAWSLLPMLGSIWYTQPPRSITIAKRWSVGLHKAWVFWVADFQVGAERAKYHLYPIENYNNNKNDSAKKGGCPAMSSSFQFPCFSQTQVNKNDSKWRHC